jgi:hypothetical protein
MCMGTLYMSGIRTLYYGSREPFAGSVNMLGTTWYLSRKPVKVFHPQNQLLELIIMSMMIEQDYQKHHGELPPIAETIYKCWMEVVPRCVPFSRILYESDTLSSARSNGASAAIMLDSVVAKVQL